MLWTSLGSFALLLSSVFWLAAHTRSEGEVRSIANQQFEISFDARQTWEDDRADVLARVSSNESIVQSNQTRLDRVEDSLSARLDRLDGRINELLIVLQSVQSFGGARAP